MTHQLIEWLAGVVTIAPFTLLAMISASRVPLAIRDAINGHKIALVHSLAWFATWLFIGVVVSSIVVAIAVLVLGDRLFFMTSLTAMLRLTQGA